MDRLATYRLMLMPLKSSLLPLPAQVLIPSMKSVGALGMAGGFQRRRLGVTGPEPKWFSHDAAPLKGVNAFCSAAGRMRYSHERRPSARGTVKAVPDSCSAYRP